DVARTGGGRRAADRRADEKAPGPGDRGDGRDETTGHLSLTLRDRGCEVRSCRRAVPPATPPVVHHSAHRRGTAWDCAPRPCATADAEPDGARPGRAGPRVRGRLAGARR